MSQKYEKLKSLLKELFQLDQPELDFGLYRIMHAKSAEVSQFLDRDLLPQVRAAFGAYKTADKAELEKELARAVEQAQGLGVDPESTQKVKDLRAKLASEAVDLGQLESEVYDHLFSFFRRYYSEGDFLAKRVYKPGVYAIPYEGEEVTLYWANKDQYYIKTSEYLRDYAFRLRPDDAKNPMRVHFRLVDAAEGEHGNVKAAEGKERRFKLAETDPLVIEDGELVVRFTYQPDPAKQKDLNAAAEAAIVARTDTALADWIRPLAAKHVRADGTASESTRLRVHLDRYTARNTFDYFIHKDLGAFLRRELDFYIKNEVMHLDDVENESAPRVEQYLSKIKVIRRIAGKIIDFLAQLEDFQKKLWLKKKFVVETSWCIRVGCIPESFYAEIAANEAQREEWVKLYGLDGETGGWGDGESGRRGERPTLFADDRTLISLSPRLRVPPSCMVDTRHFDAAFTARLLEAVGNVDEQTDGVLFHSENFQALSLMQARYRERVNCIYIDPPYNTGDSEIPYKNTYLHSSWLALMAGRLRIIPNILAPDSVLFVAIDDFEMVNLSKLIDSEQLSLRREMIIVNHHPQGGKAKTLAHTHEYMLACVSAGSDRTFAGRTSCDGAELRPFKRSGTAESNYRFGRPNSFYAVLVDSESRKVVGLEVPPQRDAEYPLGPTAEGYVRIYPIGANGEERVWRRSYESALQLVSQGKLACTEGNTIYQVIEADERSAALFSNWVDPRYNAGTFGANLLRDIIGEQNPFSYPKSVHTVGDAIFAANLDDCAQILDFFGGSGTTGHAVINLNREDGGQRKFILVEMGDYFDTVLLPRLKKVTFSPEWKDGKPKRLATPEEAERSPRIMKVVRLESYEDTLNNLETRPTETQQSLLAAAEAQGADGFKEQYLLRYMLDVETRGSQSLLNVQAFSDPTAYTLKVKRPGSDESREVNVDLLETFNWLIGLTVRHITAPQCFSAAFECDSEKRLRLKGRLKQNADGPYWFRTVTGTSPDGKKTLVIWRKLSGNPEEDNLVLDEWFTKQGYSSKDSEFDLIYVNGGNNLENLKAPDDTWKVRLIEEDFHRLMFDTQGM
jgi:adenine-specific DNA-methyltransferase